MTVFTITEIVPIVLTAQLSLAVAKPFVFSGNGAISQLISIFPGTTEKLGL